MRFFGVALRSKQMASHLLVVLLFAVASGDVYIWNGGSMNFSDSNNWNGGLVPGSSLPCTTSFGVTGKNIISQLDVSLCLLSAKIDSPSRTVLGIGCLYLPRRVFAWRIRDRALFSPMCIHANLTAQTSSGREARLLNNAMYVAIATC